ncbi:hypothetical protein GTW78_34485 [Streptomyces sp. SID4948]|nr:hypothetical protein [Streptomyces sp. SID4948]
MREVSPKFSAESFFEFGFPYVGELSYGWRSGLLHTSTLQQVIGELNRRALPLASEERDIAFRLPDDVEAVRGMVGDLQRYEKADSCDVWQYYVAAAIERATTDLATRFDLLDSAWADLEYPTEMRDVIYPEGGMPSHLDTEAGNRELAKFMHRWHERLSRRRPESRASNN